MILVQFLALIPNIETVLAARLINGRIADFFVRFSLFRRKMALFQIQFSFYLGYTPSVECLKRLVDCNNDHFITSARLSLRITEKSQYERPAGRPWSLF